MFWTGLSVTVLMIGLAVLSWQFPYGVDISQAPLPLYISLSVIAGSLLLLLPRIIRRAPASRQVLWGVIVLGLLARGAMFFSAPVLEDDSYRYFWDGAVTAQGIDPYKYAPAEALSENLFDDPIEPLVEDDLKTIQALASQNAEAHRRINYPYVSTIYPPVTQLAFAGAYLIDPFGLTGWRAVLLIFDLVTLGVLIGLLRAYQRNPLWVALYWLNPVVIMQGFGAGHMDILLLPFLLAAILLRHQNKLSWSALALAGAAGVKLWPILLFPLIAKPLLAQPLKLIGLAFLFIGATALLLAPQLVQAFQPEAGLNAYSSDWRTHAFIFALLEDGLFRAMPDPGQISRIVVALLVGGAAGWLALRYGQDRDRLPTLVVIIIASLIFLSPTGYPWYLIWLAPLLVLVPNPGLLSLMATAPLYWLRFAMGDDNPLYQWGVVTVAFGLPLILLLWSLQNKDTMDEVGHHYSRA